MKTVISASLANARAPESSVVVQTHLAAGEKIRHRGHCLPIAVCARTDRQNEVTQGKPCASLQNLLISFHLVSISSGGSSRAIPYCEYLIHESHVVIHILFTVELTAERHFCSIFKQTPSSRHGVRGAARARAASSCAPVMCRSAVSSTAGSTCTERQKMRSPAECPLFVHG